MWHVALISPLQATSQRLAELDQRLAAVEAERNGLLVERRALVGRHVQAATSQTLKQQIQLQRYREEVGMDWAGIRSDDAEIWKCLLYGSFVDEARPMPIWSVAQRPSKRWNFANVTLHSQHGYVANKIGEM